MAMLPTFGFFEFIDKGFGQVFSFLGLSDLYMIIQLLFKTFADAYLPRVNDFGMVRHLWMPEPFVEGYPPLIYSVPTNPSFLPLWLDHFFIEKNLYLQNGFMQQWLYTKAWIVLAALYYQKLVNLRFSLGFLLQVNPYMPPLSGLWFVTDWGINALSGFIPISRGMDFNPILFSALLGYFIDSTRTLTYALPYTQEDLKISDEYGEQLAQITGDEKRRFMQVQPVSEFTTNEYLFKYYFEGIPSYYLKTNSELPEGLLRQYWFGSVNGPAVIRYLLDTYPNVDIRPQFLRDRQVDEFLAQYDPLMKGKLLPSIEDKYYYYPLKEEHLPLIRETLDKWALDKRIPVNEQTINIGRQKKLEYAVAEKRIEILNTTPIKEAKEILNSFKNQSNEEILKEVDKESYNRLFLKTELLNNNGIDEHRLDQTLNRLEKDNSIQMLKNSGIVNENLNLPELLALSDSDLSIYQIYHGLDNQLNNIVDILFSLIH